MQNLRRYLPGCLLAPEVTGSPSDVVAKKIERRIPRVAIFLGVSVLTSLALAEPGDAGNSPTDTGDATFRLEISNDVFAHNSILDNLSKDGGGITGAWSLQKYGETADTWFGLSGVPGFIKDWGAAIPTLSSDGLFYGAGMAIGQVIQTPVDLSREQLAHWDVPYAGLLMLQFSWVGFNDHEMRAFQVTTGVAGPSSQAEPVHTAMHRWLNEDLANGWDNQLADEPLLNLSYMRKKKLWHVGSPSELAADIAVSGHLGLGNLLTHAGVALEMRVGANLPGGFVYIQDSAGLAMRHNARLAPPRKSRPSIYASLVLRGNAIAHDLLLDGNTLTDSHSMHREPYLAQLVAGLHYESNNWSLQFNIAFRTDYVNYDKSRPPGPHRDWLNREGNPNLGSIAFQYRY